MPATDQPLGLPDGSVRAILAVLIVAGALAIFAFTDKLGVPDLLAIVGPVTALYFGQYLSPPGG